MALSPRQALLWSFAERYANFALTLFSTVLLARLITPQQLGVYSVCAAFAAVAAILRDFGVSEYLIQERDLTRDKLRAACSIALLVAWPLAAALWLARMPLAAYFGEPGVAPVLAVMALHFVLLPLTSPAFALLNREMAFRQIFALQLACQAVAASTSLLLAFRGWGTLALAWGPVAGVMTQTLILVLLRPATSLLLPGLREARTVLRFGLMYVSSRGIETLARHVHEPIIAKCFDFTAVGLFSRAWGLVEMFNTHVADAIVRVATPAFATGHRAGRALAEPFGRATAIFACVSWAFFGFVALCAPEIIAVLFGPQWAAAAPLASILALAALPTGLHELMPQMLSATGHVQRRLRIAVVVGALHVAGVLVAAQFSLHAVAAVSMLSASVMVALGARQMRAVLGVPAWEVLRPCLGSAAVAAACVGAQWLALLVLRQADLPAIVRLAGVAAVGTIGWLLAACWLRHPAFAEVRRAASAALSKRAVPKHE
jgi:O-antigen/teichoic acid export membrane protein